MSHAVVPSSASERQLRARAHVISVDHGDRTVLLDAEGEQYFSLNRTGRIVWDLLCDGATPSAVVDRLTSLFGADRERIAQDVDALLKQLTRCGLVEQQ